MGLFFNVGSFIERIRWIDFKVGFRPLRKSFSGRLDESMVEESSVFFVCESNREDNRPAHMQALTQAIERFL